MKGDSPLFDEQNCMHCGVCINTCPLGCIDISEINCNLLVVNNNCIGCGICMASCPVDAITLINDEGR